MPTHRISKRSDELLRASGSGKNYATIGVDTDTNLVKYNADGTARSIPADSGLFTDRAVRVGVKALAGATIHAASGGVVAWQNPEAVSILIHRVVIDRTTASSGACTLDIGTTAVDATTTSDNLIDGLDANATAATEDNITDKGSNGKSRQKLASGKWVTIDEKTGDATGLVANLYIFYTVV